MIKIIVALGKDRLIGKGNALPWHISSDLAHFKKTTLNSTVVMGEKTYESMGAKPLPNRHNIVVTLLEDFDPHDERVEVSHDLYEIVRQYQDSDETLFVIGGAQIYKLFLPFTSEMVVSYIKGNYTGDIFFPPFEQDFTPYKSETFAEFDVIYYKRKD